MSQNDTENVARRSHINPPVFFISAALIIVLVAFAALYPELADRKFKALQQGIFTNASWFYILAVALILLSVTYLGLSRYGNIKLGPDHAQPDFSYVSWFAMLFSAGMGIGLMFFGVAEPVMHYLSPPVGTPETVEAAKQAMRLTFFHWGLHAWAIYAIVALILAFFSYRHGLPLTLRSALYPIIGDRIYGPLGHAVDIFAVIGTVFGVATSLGYGVLQVNAGLNHLFGLPINETVQVVLIVVITGLATLSVVSGLDKGIRILSELNLSLAILLLVLVGILGPTVLLLKSFRKIPAATCLKSSAKPLTCTLTNRNPATGWVAGRCCTGAGGSPGRRLSVCLSPAFPAAAPSANSLPACCLFRPASPCCG